jgi:hypothetical protein
MRKKLLTLIIAAALMASASGCASVFEKEYFSTTEYTDSEASPAIPTDGATEVSSYFRLKLEISRLISAHSETGTLEFRNYGGDIYDDIAAACKDVGANTALGAYCVDYISYDVNRIVAYYEAEIYITYKRTAEETSQIITIPTADGLGECVADALDKLQEHLVVMVNASLVNADEAAGFVDAACREDPLLCANKPVVKVNVFTGGGLQKLFEFNIDYGADKNALLAERKVLTAAVGRIAADATAESEAYRAFQAASALIAACTLDADAGNTAYAAVINGAADSEGMAMAFRAVCAAAGITCLVVDGRLDSEQHYWNMIEADGSWYHVDISRAMSVGLAQTFLLGDSLMWGRYWWDTEQYPACGGDLTYSSVVSAQQNT